MSRALNRPIVGDDVTVTVGAGSDGVVRWELRRDRVRAVHVSQFHANFANRMYDLADEGITWVRGFHEPNAEPLHSVLAYMATL